MTESQAVSTVPFHALSIADRLRRLAMQIENAPRHRLYGGIDPLEVDGIPETLRELAAEVEAE